MPRLSPDIRIRSDKPQRDLVLPSRGGVSLLVAGYDNSIRIHSESFCAQIEIYGCGNAVIVEEGVISGLPAFIYIGDDQTPCFNSVVRIGRGCVFSGSATIRLWEPGSSVEIGGDCLFSSGIEIWCSDSHELRDAEGRLNAGRSIRIGSHVWVGMDCKIGKNTAIADGCVIGWGSVVTGRHEEPDCVLAGVPARVCKRGIQWDAARPSQAMPEQSEALARYADWDSALFFQPWPVATGRTAHVPKPPTGLKRKLLRFFYRLKAALNRKPDRKRRYGYLADALLDESPSSFPPFPNHE